MLRGPLHDSKYCDGVSSCETASKAPHHEKVCWETLTRTSQRTKNPYVCQRNTLYCFCDINLFFGCLEGLQAWCVGRVVPLQRQCDATKAISKPAKQFQWGARVAFAGKEDEEFKIFQCGAKFNFSFKVHFLQVLSTSRPEVVHHVMGLFLRRRNPFSHTDERMNLHILVVHCYYSTCIPFFLIFYTLQRVFQEGLWTFCS